jgi:hypothetical protein
MKNIIPIKVWADGVIVEAVILSAYLTYDDLKTKAVFYYSVLGSSLISLADGKVEMIGDDYTNWDDSNDGAYNYIAGKLNLTITGDYVGPVIDSNEPE